MRKNEWIAQVAKQSNVSRVEASRILNTALDVITKALSSGDRLTLTGFGTFEVRQTAARTGTHPRTREKIKIAEHRRPAFTAGTALRSAVAAKPKAAANGKSNGKTKAGVKAPKTPAKAVATPAAPAKPAKPSKKTGSKSK
ncbi:MAG: HU family DNA-binding protein [Anaerolineae bacterium]|nr:HU family DNA-binding protein [Anaerolineae bacterium]